MTGRGWPRAATVARSAVTAAVILGGLARSAQAAEPPAPPPSGSRARPPADPILAIEGSATSWFVSKSGAGCYAMSPNSKADSRIAIGRHPTLGSGIFVIDLGLAVSRSDNHETVEVMVDGAPRAKDGQVVVAKLLFVPLAPAELDSQLRELQATGVIWLQVRGAWLGHAGHRLAEAVAVYGKDCQ